MLIYADRALIAIGRATLGDWLSTAVFAVAFVGMVEAPWIVAAMPIGPRSHASHHAASRHGLPVSIAIAGEE